jgi:hypothetical protein
MRELAYRPRLVDLEDRVAPGSILLNSLDASSLFTMGSLDRDLLVPADQGVVGMQRPAEFATSALISGGVDLSLITPDFQFTSPATASQGNASLLMNQDLGLKGIASQLQIGAVIGGGIYSQGGDTVNLGVLPGSSLSINNGALNESFGDDPPTAVLSNAFISNDGSGAGTIFVSQDQIGLPTFTFNYQGYTIYATLVPQSDGTGTYDRNTGDAEATFSFNVHVTGNAPGERPCDSPLISLDALTANDGGQQFFTNDAGFGEGVLVDNTAALGSFSHGACGGIPFVIDYADTINGQLHLPAPAGTNVLTLHIQMDPSIGP